MEERKLNEKESLELIAQMIQNSKKNLQVGRGNQFILWGWLGAITSIAVMLMLMWTKNPAWNWLWFAIPVIGWPVMMWQLKKAEKPVVTFTDKVLKAVWMTIGSIGMFSIFLMAMYAHNSHMIIPGTILLVGTGSAITGAVLDNKRLQSWVSGVFGFAMIVSIRIAFDDTDPIWNHIVFSIAFIGMLAIPGHILNKEAKKDAQRT
ncbi:MAG: hypothetical protein IJX29_06870 [Bacteroides sp.]|nr:hypothetical protein [Bacteroides sp.]